MTMKRITNTTHGRYLSKEYFSWGGMLQRCLNPNNSRYSDYGARGIRVADRWLSFENFFDDMGERPEGKTLDRINNNLGYFPENCRWATAVEQAYNKRNSLSFSGVRYRKHRARWEVCAKAIKGKQKYLGMFKTHLAACYARHAHDVRNTHAS